MTQHFNVFKSSASAGWYGFRAVYVLDDERAREQPRVFKNKGDGRHLEELMLLELKKKLPTFKEKSLRLVVYQNCSPCRSCSNKYAEFVRQARQLHDISLEMTIVFVALHNIQQPSRPRSLTLSKRDHAENLYGLVQLRYHGITVRSFQSEDWYKLSKYLEVKDPWKSEIEASKINHHCVTVAQDLEDLLGAEQSISLFWNSADRKGACCVFRCYGCSVSRLYRNSSPEQHAEHEMLNDLEKHWFSKEHLTSGEVTVFQNLSPCGACCLRYAEFLTKAKQNQRPVRLTIVLGSFYNISRPSGVGCPVHPLVSKYGEGNNLKRLLDLKKEGVRLRCFTHSDWNKLCNILEVPHISPENYSFSGRKLEDEVMKLDMFILGLAGEDMDRLCFECPRPSLQAAEGAVASDENAATEKKLPPDTVKEAVVTLGEELPRQIKDEVHQATFEAVKNAVAEIQAAVQPAMKQVLEKMLPAEVRATLVPEIQSTVTSALQIAVSAQFGKEVSGAIRTSLSGLLEPVVAAARVTEENLTRIEADLKKMDKCLCQISQLPEKTSGWLEEYMKMTNSQNGQLLVKTKNQVAQLLEETTNQTAQCLEKMENRIGQNLEKTNIRQRLEKMEDQIGQSLGRTESQIGQQMEKTKTQIGQHLDRMKTQNGQRLDKTKNQIEQSLLRTENQIGQLLEKMDNQIGQRLDRTESQSKQRLVEAERQNARKNREIQSLAEVALVTPFLILVLNLPAVSILSLLVLALVYVYRK